MVYALTLPVSEESIQLAMSNFERSPKDLIPFDNGLIGMVLCRLSGISLSFSSHMAAVALLLAIGIARASLAISRINDSRVWCDFWC